MARRRSPAGPRGRFGLEALEARRLLAADTASLVNVPALTVPIAPEVSTASTEVVVPVDQSAAVAAPTAPAAATGWAMEQAAVEGSRREIVFVDGRVRDASTLLAGMTPGVEVVVLDAHRDGVQQMAEVLAGRAGVDAVHVIAEGNEAELHLGTAFLTRESIAGEFAEPLAAIGRSLSAEADLLIYGCNFGRGAAGQEAVAQLAALTGADVAASTDRTGHAAEFADWILETATGSLETGVVVSEVGQSAWDGALATFTVTNTNNNGNGSLRKAIQDANNSAGTDTIQFAIPVTDNQHFYYRDDGIAGSLSLVTATSVADGSIADFDADYPPGTARSWYRIQINSELLITDAVVLDATSQSGYVNAPVIEIDASGVTSPDPNAIRLQAGGSTIRGLVINQAPSDAIDVETGDGSTIAGNYIGTDVSGTLARANDVGVNVKTGGNTVGGTTAADRNVISGNTGEGVSVSTASATGNVVSGNYIGVTVTGAAALGNGSHGVVVDSSAQDTTIGGMAAGAGNVIANSGGDGVSVTATAGSGNRILRNSISGNAGEAIDLGDDGVTANDSDDADAGANDLQNFPVVASASIEGSRVTISGTLNSEASTTYRIEFFANATNAREGGRYLGFTDVTTPGSSPSTVSFTATLTAAVNPGEYVTATATSATGSTSEFGLAQESRSGTALWTDDDATPETAPWNGTSLGGATATASVGEWVISEVVEAPTRTEIMAVGIDADGVIRGQMWDGSAWTAFSFNDIVDLSSATHWSFDVAYESQSGDAILVWDNGTAGTASISYRVWDGASWSVEGTITTPLSGEATQLRLAADPGSDELLLIASNASSQDYALVWNGSSWGNAQVLESTTTAENQTDVSVAYESLSGDAVVVYGNSATSAYFRVWNGSTWSAESTVTAPGGVSGAVEWSSLASDAGSDRLALGVRTTNAETWLAVWDGAAWGSTLLATTTAVSSSSPNVAIAFEHDSGDLLAVYGEAGNDKIQFRTWTSGGGWSAAADGPSVGADVPESLVLSADPNSNAIMLAVHDSAQDVSYAPWNGAAFGALTQTTGDSGVAGGLQPMAFVWADDNRVPVIATTALSAAENTTAAGTVVATDADGDTRTYAIVGGADQAKFTIDAGTGALSFLAAPDFETPTDAGGNNVYDVTVRVTDGNGGTDIQAVAVTVTNVNEAPVNSVPGAQSVAEDTTLVFSAANGNAIVVADVDAGGGSVEVTLTASNGTVTLAGTAGLTFSAGDGTADATMTFTGTVASINAALNGLGFTPTGNFTGAASLQIVTNDQGNAGSGSPLSDTDSVAITVTPVNDAPVNTVPVPQTTSEDTALVFSAANGNQISISDVDAAVGSVQVTLTATNGTLTLAGIAGLTFTAGDGTADATMTFTGTVAAINTALNGLGFNPTGNFNGAASLEIVTDDQGNTGAGVALSDTDTVAITVTAVNDPPVNTVPVPQSTNEDTALVFSAASGNQISVSDLDAAGNNIQVTLTATNGTLTLAGTAGLAFTTGDGTADGTMTFTGSAASINAALDGLVFSPAANHNGAASLQIVTDDLGFTGSGGPRTDSDTVGITVNAVNDAPTLTMPSSQVTSRDVPFTFSNAFGNAVQVGDVDAGGSAVRVTLSVGSGTLTLATTTGLTFLAGDGTGDAAMTFQGTLASVNAALDGLVYAPATGFVGIVALSVTANDLGATGSGGAQSVASSVDVEVVVETRVNTVTAGNQTEAAVAMDDAGNSVVVWTSDGGQDGDGRGVFAQRFNPLGAKVGGEIQVNTFVAGDQTRASVAMDDAGNFVVVWASNGQDGSKYGIYGQRFDAGGNTIGGEFRVNVTASGSQDEPDIAMTATGGFVVAWKSDPADTDTRFDIHARRYDAAGNALTGEITANTNVANNQDQPAVAIDDAGNFVVVWRSTSGGSGKGVYGQRFDAAGNALGAEFRANTTDSGDQDRPEIAMAGDGRFVIAWTSGNNQDGDNKGIYAQRYSAAGVAQGGELLVNTTTNNTQDLSSVGMDAAGNFTIAWTSNNQDVSGKGVYARQFDAAGNAISGEFRVSGTQNNNQDRATVAMSTIGDLIIGWQGNGVGDTSGVFVQIYQSTNDAPVNTIPPAQSTAEDTTLVFSTANGNRISVADVDALTSSVQVTLTAANGTLTLAGTAGLTFTAGDGTGDATMTFTGTIASVNAALDGLTFSPSADFNGATSIQVVTSDLGNTGAGGPLTDTDTVSITVTAVNDAPVNTVPVAQTTAEDTALVFSGANGNQISIGDLDAAANNVQVALTVTNGTLTLAGIAGLAFTSGDGTADATMTFTGTMASINAALNGLSFIPTTNYNGPASLTILTSDLGNTGTGGALTDSDAVAITITAVNDAPVNTVPVAQTTAEDTALVFSAANGNAISIGDLDAGGATVQVTLTATNGTLTLPGTAGLTFTAGDGTGDATMTFTGTIASINAALDGLGFSPSADFNGAASLQIVTSDLGNSGAGGPLTDTDTVAITVTAVNDAPVNTVPVAQTTAEDTALVFSAANGNQISVGDLDAAAGNVQVALTVTNGTLTLAGIAGLAFTSGDGTADATMTFTGTMASINAALNGLSFIPTTNYNGPASLTILTSDLGNTGTGGALTDSDAVAITITAVNDAPVNTVPVAQITAEDTALVFSAANGNAISIGDLDAGGATVQVTLTATNGTLTLPGTAGLTFTAGDGTGDATMTFTGTIASINAALDGLGFSPSADFNGAASLQIVTSDLGNSGAGGPLTDTDTVAITVTAVNDAPVNTVPVAQTTAEDTALVFSAANGNQISVGDLDAAASNVQVALTVTNGTLTLAGTAGLTFTAGDGTSDGAMTFTGTMASINTALNGLSFSPTANYNGPASLQIVTNDLGNSGAGVALTDTDTVAITVTAVNDAPVNTVPGAQTTSEDTALVFSAANGNRISIGDLDAGGATVRVTLTATNGTLTLPGTTGLAFSVGDGTGDAAMTFTGTIASINAALDGLSFSPSANFNGATSIQIVTSDLGNTGTGGPLTDTDTVTITVTPVNDGPVNTVPGAQTTSEDTALVFSAANGNPISIGDVDAAAGTVQVTLTATNGTLTLAGTTGLAFTGGDGTADLTMTFTGTIASINTALDGLTFNPTADFEGAAALQIATSDRGNSGAGGALSDTDTVAIAVTAVNDAPTIGSDGGGASTSTTITENTAGVTTVVSTDIDEPAQPLTYAIVGGADRAKFTIDATTGVLSFVAAPNFEALADADRDNVYEVTVQVEDGAGGIDTQTIAVTVTDVNDAPVITSDVITGGRVSVVEGRAAVTHVTATDEDVPAQALTYSIAGGRDAALFSIDPETGEIAFVQGFSAEAGRLYELVVRVSDTDGGTTTQALVVMGIDPGSATDEEVSATIEDAPAPITAVDRSSAPGAMASGGTAREAGRETTPATTDAEDVLLPAPQVGLETALVPSTTMPERPILPPITVPMVAATSPSAPPAPLQGAEDPSILDQPQQTPVMMAEAAVRAGQRAAALPEIVRQALLAVEAEFQRALAASGESTVAVRGVTLSTGVLLSTGLVTWLARGSAMASGLMMILPTWRGLDPLPILALTDSDRNRRLEALRGAAEDEANEHEGLRELFD